VKSGYKTFPMHRASNIKLLILDVDGVLTDGRVILGNAGAEHKMFNVRDGHGVKLAQRAGIQVGILTGRTSDAVNARAKELGIRLVVQGSLNKKEGLNDLLRMAKLDADCCAFMGDDIVDLPAMRMCQLNMTPSDAHPAILSRAHWVSDFSGGHGAVRQAIEGLILAVGAWQEVIERPYGISEVLCGWST